jgi:hypoxanthine phosphoribosyltransferase
VAASVQAEYDRRKMDDPLDCRFSVKECERLLKELIPNDARKMRITIIIDALDECKDGGYELLKYLKSILSSRPQSVRLLLSSQMHVQVAPYFRDDEIQSIEINPTRTIDDMQNFIKKEMEKQRNSPLKGILDSDQALRGQVVKELSVRATGM